MASDGSKKEGTVNLGNVPKSSRATLLAVRKGTIAQCRTASAD